MTTSTTPRFDPILPLHKAVRHVMFDVLTDVGALDSSDIFAVDRCSRQVLRLLALLPDAAPALLPRLDALHQRDPAARRAAAIALYDELTALVTDQLVQQRRREAEDTPAQQAAHSDADLRELRRGQLAAASESELADALRAMALALSPQELGEVLDDVQASTDAQTFSCLVDTVRRQMSAERWARVARQTGLSETHAGNDDGRRRPGTASAAGGKVVALQRRVHRAERHRGLTQ